MKITKAPDGEYYVQRNGPLGFTFKPQKANRTAGYINMSGTVYTPLNLIGKKFVLKLEFVK